MFVCLSVPLTDVCMSVVIVLWHVMFVCLCLELFNVCMSVCVPMHYVFV